MAEVAGSKRRMARWNNVISEGKKYEYGNLVYVIRPEMPVLTHMKDTVFGLTWNLGDEPSVCADKNCQL